jgi:hypothetical protein
MKILAFLKPLTFMVSLATWLGFFAFSSFMLMTGYFQMGKEVTAVFIALFVFLLFKQDYVGKAFYRIFFYVTVHIVALVELLVVQQWTTVRFTLFMIVPMYLVISWMMRLHNMVTAEDAEK